MDKLAKWRAQMHDARASAESHVKAAQGGPSPLDPVHRDFITGTHPDSALQVARDLWKIFSNPVSAGTEVYQSAKIEALQQAFREKFGDRLRAMALDMDRARRRMDDLATLTEQAWEANVFDTHEPYRLLDQKAKVGDTVLDHIRERLDATPADQNEKIEKLTALQKNMEAWMHDSDARVQSDREEVNKLERRAGPLRHAAFVQQQFMKDAADKAFWAGNTDHTRAQTALFVAGLRQFLVVRRASVDQALGALLSRVGLSFNRTARRGALCSSRASS